MGELRRTRPVFHSEADVQHALAWTAHLFEPSLRVRLEDLVKETASIERQLQAHRGGVVELAPRVPRATAASCWTTPLPVCYAAASGATERSRGPRAGVGYTSTVVAAYPYSSVLSQVAQEAAKRTAWLVPRASGRSRLRRRARRAGMGQAPITVPPWPRRHDASSEVRCYAPCDPGACGAPGRIRTCSHRIGS